MLGGLQISQVVNLALRLFYIRLAVTSWDRQIPLKYEGMLGLYLKQ